MDNIAESTVRRLSWYYRVLDEVHAEGGRTISSHRLAERQGIASAQVRKDLSYFGSFGKRGLGYDVEHLRTTLRAILGLDKRWRVALVGAGHIGAALAAYRGFGRQGFDVAAVFDSDPARVGTVLAGHTVRDVAELGEVAALERIEIGVVATPAAAAQAVADALVRAGVRAILNFAPRNIAVPAGIHLRAVDLTLEFEVLSYGLRLDEVPRRRRHPG
jgi:redox-sensing transcriptional repressor